MFPRERERGEDSHLLSKRVGSCQAVWIHILYEFDESSHWFTASNFIDDICCVVPGALQLVRWIFGYELGQSLVVGLLHAWDPKFLFVMISRWRSLWKGKSSIIDHPFSFRSQGHYIPALPFSFDYLFIFLRKPRFAISMLFLCVTNVMLLDKLVH